MKERLQELLDKEELTPVKFSQIVGVQRSSVSHILSGRNNPGLDFLQKILNNFPQINSDWLITGKGFMYRKVETKDAYHGTTPAKNTHRKADLFSSLNDEERGPYTKPVEPSSETVQGASFKQTGESKTVSTPPSNSPQPERIVIFYSDGTFREYMPHMSSSPVL